MLVCNHGIVQRRGLKAWRRESIAAEGVATGGRGEGGGGDGRLLGGVKLWLAGATNYMECFEKEPISGCSRTGLQGLRCYCAALCLRHLCGKFVLLLLQILLKSGLIIILNLNRGGRKFALG